MYNVGGSKINQIFFFLNNDMKKFVFSKFYMAKVDEVNKKFDSKIIGLHLNSIHIDGDILAKKVILPLKKPKSLYYQ